MSNFTVTLTLVYSPSLECLSVTAFRMYYNSFFCFVLFFGGCTGLWTQGIAFARQSLSHLRHTHSCFCCGYLLNRVSLLCLGRAGWRPSYSGFLSRWDDKCMTPCSAVLVKMVYFGLFCLGWPQIVVLPISVSRIARITDMSHSIWQHIVISLCKHLPHWTSSEDLSLIYFCLPLIIIK
jgi:hypothetical protein